MESAVRKWVKRISLMMMLGLGLLTLLAIGAIAVGLLLSTKNR